MLERNEVIIKQKLNQYLLPGIMLTVALQLGNIVDSMLVGNLLGPEAMSAVKIGMAVDNIVEIPGYVLGVGGSIAAGVLMGNRKTKKAKQVFSATFFISLFFGLLFSIASIGSPYYAKWLCGGGSLTADAQKFIFVTLLLAPVLNVALQMINYVAVDNNPGLASAYVILANILNLSCDYVLLKYTSLGTAGAALSTSIGYGSALLILIFYIKSPKRILSFVNPFIEFKDTVVLAIKSGIPTLLYMICLTVKDMTLNTMIVNLVGETSMIVYTVCYNVALCVQLVAGGIVGLLSSIGSVLYGERDYFGIRSLLKHVIRYSFTVLIVLMAAIVIKPDVFLQFFGVTNNELVGPAMFALRIYTISLPFYLWNKLMTTYYQSTEKTMLSSIVTSLQTCVAVVPLAYVFISLSRVLGFDSLNAMIISLVASEIVTLLVTFIYQKIKYGKQNYFMLPKEEEIGRDFTVCKNANDISETVKMVFSFCTENSISKDTANRMAVATEEMLGNIFKYGGKKAGYVDVYMHITGQKLNMRLTDNGIPFNPLEYDEEETEFDIHGIDVVKKISTHIEYLRVLDLNHTMIEIDNSKGEEQ